MTNLARLLTMIRYEFLMQWRRRALLVLLLVMIVLPAVLAIVLRAQAGGGRIDDPRVVTVQLLTTAWPPLFVVLAIFLPPIFTDAVPRDRQLGVRELLGSLPLGLNLYLAGKVLGACAAAAAGVLAAMAGIAAVWWLAVGAFDPRPFVVMVLAGALPTAALGATLGVLLPATQPTRARAAFMGIAFAAFCLFSLGSGMVQHESLWNVFNPGRPYLLDYFTWGQYGIVMPSATRAINAGDVAATLAAGALETAAVWVAVWAWLRRPE